MIKRYTCPSYLTRFVVYVRYVSGFSHVREDGGRVHDFPPRWPVRASGPTGSSTSATLASVRRLPCRFDGLPNTKSRNRIVRLDESFLDIDFVQILGVQRTLGARTLFVISYPRHQVHHC